MAKPHRKYTRYDDRTNTGIALEHTVTLSRMVLSAGVLMNHNTLFSSDYNFYPSVNAAYHPVENLKISASWNKSTRMPTFTDLYYTTDTHTADETLKPEKSEALDLNINYKGRLFQAYLTGFLLWGRNMIDWVKEHPDDTKWASWNLTEIDTQGFETGILLHTGQLWAALGERSTLSVDYARMHQTCDTKDLLSLYALNYLRDKFTAQFTHDLCKGLTASWYFRFQKRMGLYEQYENGEKTGNAPYPSFSTTDLKLAYRYKAITFHLNLNNLYDTRYFDLGNIPQPGFWLTGGISYAFR